MHPVEAYLKRLREIRRTGHHTPETSFYGALEDLLNEVGKKLMPRVIAVMSLANRGPGLPDGGLFIAWFPLGSRLGPASATRQDNGSGRKDRHGAIEDRSGHC